MDSRLDEIVRVLTNLSQSEWDGIEQAVNMAYSTKAAKLTLNDPEELKMIIKQVSPSL